MTFGRIIAAPTRLHVYCMQHNTYIYNSNNDTVLSHNKYLNVCTS